MATSSIALARGSFPTEADLLTNPIDPFLLYELPSLSTVAILTSIVVVNAGSNLETFTLEIDGVALFSNTPINANSTISIDMKQTINTEITGFASNSAVKIHMSGVEVA